MTNEPPPFQSILITGASVGIGAALALAYARPGIMLRLGGRDEAALSKVTDVCRRNGAEVTMQLLDVTDQRAMATWITDCDTAMPLDLVIANAGISGGTSAQEGEEAQARQVVATNVFGTMNTIFPALRLMRERRRGTLAIVSSLASFRGIPGSGAYGASKAAVRIWAETLDAENAPYGLRILAICPGYVTTRMTARNNFMMPGLMDADRAAQIIIAGLASRKRRIVFPFVTSAALTLLMMLPFGLSQKLLRRHRLKGVA